MRQQNDLTRQMRQAKLPRTCNLDTFDFNHSAGITKPQLRQLRELIWLDQLYNIIFMGPSGTGKTFMAAGLVRNAVLRGYRAHFPTLIRNYKNGVAQVSWQINPDGRYYMDEDGFGMSDDEELEIYGYIDRSGKVLVKFKHIREDWDELKRMQEEAEKLAMQKE